MFHIAIEIWKRSAKRFWSVDFCFFFSISLLDGQFKVLLWCILDHIMKLLRLKLDFGRTSEEKRPFDPFLCDFLEKLQFSHMSWCIPWIISWSQKFFRLKSIFVTIPRFTIRMLCNFSSFRAYVKWTIVLYASQFHWATSVQPDTSNKDKFRSLTHEYLNFICFQYYAQNRPQKQNRNYSKILHILNIVRICVFSIQAFKWIHSSFVRVKCYSDYYGNFGFMHMKYILHSLTDQVFFVFQTKSLYDVEWMIQDELSYFRKRSPIGIALNS